MGTPKDWIIDSDSCLVHVPSARIFPPSDYSYFINPEPGILLTSGSCGPERIPARLIEGITPEQIRGQVVRNRFGDRFLAGDGVLKDESHRVIVSPTPVTPRLLEIPRGKFPTFPPRDLSQQSPTAPQATFSSPRTQLRLPPYIAVCGQGPRSPAQTAGVIRQHGSEPVDVGDSSAEFLVVGTRDWFIDDLEAHICARRGKHLFIFSQELFDSALSRGRNPFDPPDTAELDRFSGHPALKALKEEGFDWMNLDTDEASAQLTEEIEQVAESPLHVMGYRTGNSSSLTTSARRSLLKQAFDDELPTVGGRAYSQRWGRPGTRRRLRRMAKALLWFSRGAIGRQRELGHDMTTALQDWHSDLEWMKANLYEEWMRFRWPSFKVPD